MKHIILTGERGVGKSTLLQRLLVVSRRPYRGFYTFREEPNEEGSHPIYIHDATDPRREYTAENLVGLCGRPHRCFPAVFETLGLRYLRRDAGELLIMDELGFMEEDASRFRAAVLAELDGAEPVIAIVKEMDGVSFIEELKAHPNADVYTVTEENRDRLYEELSETVVQWNTLH